VLTCIALYRGERLSELELITLCSDQEIVAEFVDRLLDTPDLSRDPALAKRREGIRKALRVIAGEVRHV